MKTKHNKPKEPPLESSLRKALESIDHQLAREFSSRSPETYQELGVSKSEPMQERVERIASFLIQEFGNNQIQLEGVSVLAEAVVKVLNIISHDLDPQEIGRVRSALILRTLERIASDSQRAISYLSQSDEYSLN